MLRPAPRSDDGERLAAALSDRSTAIGRVVPAGCEAYARIFPRAHDGVAPRRWSDLLGQPPTALTRWEHVIAAAPPGIRPSIESGSLDASTSSRLATALAGVTAGDTVNVALWDGYADAEPHRGAPAVVFPPDRLMLLLTATWREVARPVDGRAGGRRATRWWPADLSWTLGGDIYSHTVVLGGTAWAVAAVAADPLIEATPLHTDDDLRDLD